MNKPLNIRDLVRRGPNDRDDVQVIVAVAMRDISGSCENLKRAFLRHLWKFYFAVHFTPIALKQGLRRWRRFAKSRRCAPLASVSKKF